MYRTIPENDQDFNNAAILHPATTPISDWNLYINVSRDQLPGLGKNEFFGLRQYYYPLTKLSNQADHLLEYNTCDTSTAEIDYFNYGTISD